MKIGVDIDDVLVSFYNPLMQLLNRKLGTNVGLDEVYDPQKFHDIFKKEKKEIISILKDLPNLGIYEDLKFIEGAELFVKDLLREHEVIFITSRAEDAEEVTRRFLNKHFSGFKFGLEFSSDAWKNKRKEKHEICEENNINLMLEDEKYSLKCAKKGIRVLLLDKPWNREVEHKNILRVKNWGEIMEEVCKLNLMEAKDG